eukprot:COSAG06_NODE_180_length_20940_cov_7.005758_5_plen_426_part_00
MAELSAAPQQQPPAQQRQQHHFRRAIGPVPLAPPRGLNPVASSFPRQRSQPAPASRQPPPAYPAERAAVSTASLLQGRAAGRGAAAIIADARRQLERVHASRLPPNAEWRQAYDRRQVANAAENQRRSALQSELQAELAALVDAVPSVEGTDGAGLARRPRLPDMDADSEEYLRQLSAELHHHRTELRARGRGLERALADERQRAEAAAAEHALVEAELRDEIARLSGGEAAAPSGAFASSRGEPDSDTLLIRWLESGGTEVLAECAGYGAAAAAKSRGADVSATSLLAAAAAATRSDDALPGTALLHAVVQAVVDATLVFVPPSGFASLDDVELEAAAVKIQALTRGRQQRAARRRADHSRPEVYISVGEAHTTQSFVDELEDDALTRLEVSSPKPMRCRALPCSVARLASPVCVCCCRVSTRE